MKIFVNLQSSNRHKRIIIFDGPYKVFREFCKDLRCSFTQMKKLKIFSDLVLMWVQIRNLQISFPVPFYDSPISPQFKWWQTLMGGGKFKNVGVNSICFVALSKCTIHCYQFDIIQSWQNCLTVFNLTNGQKYCE